MVNSCFYTNISKNTQCLKAQHSFITDKCKRWGGTVVKWFNSKDIIQINEQKGKTKQTLLNIAYQ